MLKKYIEQLSSIYATIISGVFLFASLILPKLGMNPPIFLNPAWITALISGVPLVVSAIRKLIYNSGIKRISSALLISIAMSAAIAIGDLFAAGEVAFIMAMGEILEDKTTERAKKGLKKLIKLSPTKGRIIENGKEKTVSAAEIKKGDILRILPGETIPVDGIIISGNTSIDQSVITGESLPIDKGVGDDVFCGTLNCFGAIDIKATKVGADSSLEKLINLVKQAERNKAPMHRTADKWASRLVPAALLVAIIAGLIKQDIVVAVTVLVVFCPCALVLATPTAIMAAIGQATKHGVIIKSGEALEKMGRIDTIAFDKTGTLTYGKLHVSDIIPIKNNYDNNRLIYEVASAEQKSEHPLGKAIVAYARQKNIKLSDVDNFRLEAGKGISASLNGASLLCGNERLINENGVEITEMVKNQLEILRNQGKALVIAAADNEIIGIVALCDTIKPKAEKIVESLLKLKTDTILLTGDSEKAAKYFADKVKIQNIRAELLPEEKVASITELQSSGKTVCMIGDGINDAPALKTADVGIAMANMGSDIAQDAADIALIGDDIEKIPYLKKLSIATVKTIKFSIFLSLFINFLAIILSFFGILNPTTGALVHNAGSCFVVLIAALLYDRKFDI